MAPMVQACGKLVLNRVPEAPRTSGRWKPSPLNQRSKPSTRLGPIVACTLQRVSQNWWTLYNSGHVIFPLPDGARVSGMAWRPDFSGVRRGADRLYTRAAPDSTHGRIDRRT